MPDCLTMQNGTRRASSFVHFYFDFTWNFEVNRSFSSRLLNQERHTIDLLDSTKKMARLRA